MPTIFGDNSDGFANETEIINYINSTKFFDRMNRNMQNFLEFTFDQDLSGYTVSATKPRGMVKPDIAITINRETKYVSVKKGSGNSVHQEPLSSFVTFLYNLGISDECITYLKEFHYGDGSIDGNGGQRISAAEWTSQNARKLRAINSEFDDAGVLEEVFNRVLFEGNVPPAPVVDVMFHGNINSALWASREEILDYLLSRRNTANNVHFSNLTYQVWNRNLNHNPNTANRRHVMQIKWASLSDDLRRIRR